ncbi:MAG: hemolysin III family protein [Bacteroidales bacterium]|nr:hemolysin III family protein [Bacteroidales bacterium]HPD94522.1 hemolysin III family protein [Tenuifilaceae bacterium]HRX32152.1 hemolysin III family protein [Tenuifilaceae bacterium]
MVKTKAEEIVNSTSHGVGVGLAIAATVLLIIRAAMHGNAWHVVSYSIFGAGLINLYTASTLFHSAINPRVKYNLNKFDHSSIYILIAATYTPFALLVIRGWLGWTIFGIVWFLAIAGLVYKIWFYSDKFRKLSAWLYIVMGWIGLIAIVPIIKNAPSISLWFLLSGCLAYTVSVVFYLKDHIPYVHGIFHLFIIFGSACHFFSLYFLIG